MIGHPHDCDSNPGGVKMHAQIDEPRFCKACGDKIINWGAHAERCYGRPRTLAPGGAPTPAGASPFRRRTEGADTPEAGAK